jgi:hypothetical protein
VPTPGCAARSVRDTAVAAVVALYPPTDLSRLSSTGYLGGMDRFLGGSLSTVPGRYRDLSPFSHVDPDDPPTFLAYGGDDQIVPPGQSELLGERLSKAGVPHRLVKLPWANHTFDFLWGGWGSQITRIHEIRDVSGGVFDDGLHLAEVLAGRLPLHADLGDGGLGTSGTLDGETAHGHLTSAGRSLCCLSLLCRGWFTGSGALGFLCGGGLTHD